MYRLYEDDGTCDLAKSQNLRAVVPPKKIVNSLGTTISNFTNNVIISDITFLD